MFSRLDGTLNDAMKAANSKNVYKASQLLGHYDLMRSLGEPDSHKPNYLKKQFATGAEMADAIRAIVAKVEAAAA